MVTEVGSELSHKTRCFGDIIQNDDTWEKELGACSKDIRWLVLDEHDICGLVRKAPRRLDTYFPKLLPGEDGGWGETTGVPLGPAPSPPRGEESYSHLQRGCWCPRGRLGVTRG